MPRPVVRVHTAIRRCSTQDRIAAQHTRRWRRSARWTRGGKRRGVHSPSTTAITFSPVAGRGYRLRGFSEFPVTSCPGRRMISRNLTQENASKTTEPGAPTMQNGPIDLERRTRISPPSAAEMASNYRSGAPNEPNWPDRNIDLHHFTETTYSSAGRIGRLRNKANQTQFRPRIVTRDLWFVCAALATAAWRADAASRRAKGGFCGPDARIWGKMV